MLQQSLNEKNLKIKLMFTFTVFDFNQEGNKNNPAFFFFIIDYSIIWTC